jgi:alkaline phosphatase D
MRWHTPDESERVYRRISYGPLVDVFVLDMRSYRGPNTHNRQPEPGPDSVFMGPTQIEWLIRELQASKATWKVIASDMPLGLLVEDGKDDSGRPRFEAVANGEGPALGRELEIARLLSALKRNRIRNLVWLTGDVHYTAAHYYDPDRARFRDFDPFWEFVSGPLHAGAANEPRPTDDTFGTTVMFQRTAKSALASPYEGMLFFGEVTIEGRTGELTVRLKDLENVTHFTKTLPADRR